jgi:ATP-dependent DNA helicase RecG
VDENQTNILSLKGVGPKKVTQLATLGITTVEDLLFYFPFRYDDLGMKKISELVDGEKATLYGTVVSEPAVSYFGRKNRLSFRMVVDEVSVLVTFFNQGYLKNSIEAGQDIAVYGKWNSARVSLSGMKLVAQKDLGETSFSPIYHINAEVKQRDLIKLIHTAIEEGYADKIEENLPEELRTKYRLMGRKQAVIAMHFPNSEEEHRQALRRMKFEEFFYFQFSLQLVRQKERQSQKGEAILYDVPMLKDFTHHLPFELTNAQKRVTNEIAKDLRSPYHMLRLLQGDVGSGKTVIAAIAMYAAATVGVQSALMAPTEILAEQHAESLYELYKGWDVNIAILTGSTKAKARRLLLEELKAGEIDVLVGTHALFTDDVEFQNLGLVITDEQHRFGVNQRRLLREKGEEPDVLYMTATPIPRTLAITSFGEMDVSIIDELPAGRKEIDTRWVKHNQMDSVLQFVKTELAKNHQAYFISPLIEESEELDLQNAMDLFEQLKMYFGENVTIGLLHGRMKADEKDEVMQEFKEKKIDVLVSTTVVEVGVNVPNATVMVIMDADRFGLSQLHQLRGRVGRGEAKSTTFLVANPKTDSGRERMKIMTETNNGFVLAEEDLKLRGSGDIFGTKQSGLPNFSVGDIVVDANVMETARMEAKRIFEEANSATNPDFQMIMAQTKKNKLAGFFD